MGTTVTLKSVKGHSIGFDAQLDSQCSDPAVIQIDLPQRWSYASAGDIYREGLNIEVPAEIMDELALAWLQYRADKFDDSELVEIVKKREGQAETDIDIDDL